MPLIETLDLQDLHAYRRSSIFGKGTDIAQPLPMQQLFRLNIGEGTISPVGGDENWLGQNEDGLLIDTCGSRIYNRMPPPAVLVPKGSSRAFIFPALL